MRWFSVAAVCLGLALSTAALDDAKEWELWKIQHSKQYGSTEEDASRFTVFQQNLRFIEAHPQTPYTVSMNLFGDLTAREFGARYARGAIHTAASEAYVRSVTNHLVIAPVTTTGGRATGGGAYRADPNAGNTPSTWDWRTKGVIGPVANQGAMSEVAAVVATDNLNALLAIKNNAPFAVECAVDNLVDCVTTQTLNAMLAYATSHGVDTVKGYPDKGSCNWNPKTLCVQLLGAQNMTSESMAQTMLYQNGPLSASFDAGQTSFQFYSGGVYNAVCSPVSLDHALLLVGYGSMGSQKYWIAQNSWGVTWGLNGYAYIGRGSNVCGIMSNTLAPTMPQ